MNSAFQAEAETDTRLGCTHLTAVRGRRNVLTQFNSHTLNTHLTQAYPPAVLGGPARTGFVDVLACHQTPQSASWCAPRVEG